MNNIIKKFAQVFIVMIYFLNASLVFSAEIVNINASDLIPRAEIKVTPSSATFIEDAIFEVPILLNTKGRSMNTVDLNIQYDPNRLSIVKPSTGKSIIGIWVQPPKYDNTKGTANFAGSIPGGIVSDSSLIITITFQAKSAGTAEVRVMDTSSVLANDGIGTQARLSTSRGVYTILPKPPGGLSIYSDTHSFQDHWYNNNSPTLGWNRDPEVVGFSYILDNKPNTIPDNQNISNDTSKSYQDLNDGLWYFHIKALRNGGAWGTTTHYLIRIDTTPPAKFEPKVNYFNDDNINRALITFFTTDSLSGMDHYEIGVIDKTQSETSSPLFVRSESPYQVPASAVENSRVIVRAYDLAGNSIDTQVSVRPPTVFVKWFNANSSSLLIYLLIFIILMYIIHYLWGHKVLKRLQLISHLLKGNKTQDVEEVVKEVEEVIAENEKVSYEEHKPVVDSVPTKPEIETVIELEPKMDLKPEPEPEPKPEPKPEPELEPELEPEPKPEPKPELEIKPEPKEEIEPEIKPEIQIPKIVIEEPIIDLPIEEEIEVPIPPIKITPTIAVPVAEVPQVQIPKEVSIQTVDKPSMQISMIKDKLSKPVVNFQEVVDQDTYQR
jgi:hypothetical protein